MTLSPQKKQEITERKGRRSLRHQEEEGKREEKILVKKFRMTFICKAMMFVRGSIEEKTIPKTFFLTRGERERERKRETHDWL